MAEITRRRTGELPAPPAGSTVAIKFVDMLGEELVVTLTP